MRGKSWKSSKLGSSGSLAGFVFGIAATIKVATSTARRASARHKAGVGT
jgi:hypothetical protein